MKIAILIGNQIEEIDMISNLLNNLLIDNLDYDTFIYTNKRYKDKIKFFKNVKCIDFVEDNHEDINEELKIKNLELPSNIFQYFKLKKCFSLLEKYSNKNNIKYDCIIRIRSDICKSAYKLYSSNKEKYCWTMKTEMNRPFWVPNIIEENVVYAKTDQFYMGNYDTMKKISNLYDYIFKYYGVKKNTEYWKLNYETISKSDMNSVRFDMLVYPSIINKDAINSFTDSGKLAGLTFDDFSSLNKNDKWKRCYELKDNLKNDIINKLHFLNDYEYKSGDNIITGNCGSIHRPFRAEKFFCYYATSIQNLFIKEFLYIRNSG
jgi:hypothetical protein